jgi:hypothetical protein
MSKKMLVSFNPRDLFLLEELTRRGGFASKAEATKESVLLRGRIVAQMDQGFTDVVVRNPKSGKERGVVIS